MNYPNKSKGKYKKTTSYANRGMDLEALINESNKYYLETDEALIYKKPTEIGINKVVYKPKLVIKDAYFKSPSTLDYNGIYKGKYIEFDAKETSSKTSFPLSNIMSHQLKHIEKVIDHGGICFLIIKINEQLFLLPGNKVIEFINNYERKSIPYEYIKNNGSLLQYGYNPLIDYLKIVDILEEGGLNNGSGKEKEEK